MAAAKSVRDLIGVGPDVTRVQLPYGVAALVGLGVHVSLLAIFSALGVWPMAAVNVGSVATFVVVLMLFRQGRLTVALSLAITEVVVHQVLGVWFCGWSLGSQYYLLTVVPLCLMLPGVPTSVGVATGLIPAAVFAVLAVLELEDVFDADYPIPEPFASYVGLFNLLFSFAILWVFIAFYRRGSEHAEGRLADVVARSERLLHGILPPLIVDRLRERPGVVADAFAEVTVLFTDLVGFTTLAAQKSPEEVVVLLDEIFASFDDLVTARGLEKIKTIGDAYMVAAGIPVPRADHAQAMAELALEFQAAMVEHSARLGQPLEVRIGIHSGPVVAGVIGKSKFAYDLWGDAVNTASRMESHGAPGRIHLTQATRDLLGDAFALEERGLVEIKGKGPMRTYWLEGRAAA